MQCDFGDEIRADRTYKCLRPGCTRVRITDFAPWQLHWPCESASPERIKVGNAFSGICFTLGVSPVKGCGCADLLRRMNALGSAGCREHREELTAKLRGNYQLYDWTDKLKAAWAAVTSGLAWELEDWSDPLASLFELAIRRAELNTPSPPPTQ